ncbi:MAG TPA: hypothetical protein VMH20_12965 [Verrucomicrobiae bacterium]|nr:hypothetical protein [Verrucomicrobiae bacterium]
MKTNTLLTACVVFALGVSTECACKVVAKIFQLVCLVGLFASNCTAGVSRYTWPVSTVLALARTAIWDGRVVAFTVLHVAMWFAKIFVLAAVLGG